jgi:hypothetical protein
MENLAKEFDVCLQSGNIELAEAYLLRMQKKVKNVHTPVSLRESKLFNYYCDHEDFVKAKRIAEKSVDPGYKKSRFHVLRTKTARNNPN